MLVTEPESAVLAEKQQQSGLGQKLLAGTSALGAATLIERGMSFLASLMAARLGGASVFGAYSLALTTANNIAAYTGSGIGNTATRFAGAHDQHSPEYGPIARALLMVTGTSALLASLLMLAASGPLAKYVLHNPGVQSLLACSALSAAAVISLECARGFLLGQRKHTALLLLSVLAGAGLLAVLPAASFWGAQPMVLGHGIVVIGAVLICVLLAGPLGLKPTSAVDPKQAFAPVVRQVWGFGMVQLGSLLSMNIAGWWMTSLIARADTSMAQIGFFAVSHQIRNMVALAPSMLTQSSYALMVDGAHSHRDTGRVVTLCTATANFIALLMAGSGIVVLPWALLIVYGKAYLPAVLPTALALATAVAHMGAAPVLARLTVLDVRRAGVVNVLWAALVALAATKFISGGGAIEGAAIYLGAHLVSGWLAVFALRPGHIPSGVIPIIAVSQVSACALVALAFARAAEPNQQVLLTGGMAGVLALSVGLFAMFARHYRWLPQEFSLNALLSMIRGIRR